MSAYEQFSQAVHQHLTRDPNQALTLGLTRDLDRLPDPSQAWIDHHVSEGEALMRQAEAFDRSQLGFDESLDIDMAKLALSLDLIEHTLTFNGRTEPQQKPTAGDDLGDGLFLLFINDPRSEEARLSDITSRLEGVPAYLDALISRLDTPVKRWVDIDLEKVAGLPSLFSTIQGWADGLEWPGCIRLSAAREAAEDALTDYQSRLAALPTTDNLHIGIEETKRIIAARGIEMSPAELHQMARDFLADTTQTIAELHKKLLKKYDLPADTSVEGLQSFLLKHYRVNLKDDDMSLVVDRYEQERGKILQFIQDRDLFPLPPAQDMKIMQTPAFMAPSIPAGAMMPPPPFREGSKVSLVYLTLAPELLDEHSELGIPSMMIHEGIPGHHLQLSWVACHSSLLRRHVDANDLAEGWTTMLEDYMLDMGYMGDLTDEARFIGKRDLSRIGARVAIDLFFMSGDRAFLDVGVPADISSPDPFVAAGNLLQAVTGFTSARVQTELNWNSQERGYPMSYLTGNTLVWALKRDVIEAQKGKLEGIELDRTFHRVLLSAGNLPVAALRRVFEHQGLV